MIETLGNGLGYVFEVDASSNIINYWPNNRGTEMYLRSVSQMKAPWAGEKRAFAQQTITTVTGASNITALDINGVDQLGALVAVTAGNPTQTATDIVTQINATTPASGPRFTAISQGAVITFLDPNAGISENGFAILWTDSVPGNVVLTGDTTIHDGSLPTGNYDTRTVMVGTRTFLNSDPSAPANSLTGATEITSIINMRGTQSPVDVQQITASAATISYTRNQQETLLIVQGNINVEVINGVGAQAGDKVTIVGYASGNGFTAIDRTVATAAGKNIVLDAAENYASDGPPDMLNLFYMNDNTLGFVFSDRQGAAVTTAKVRTAAATPSVIGVEDVALVAGGLVYSIVPGLTGAPPGNTTYKNFVRVTGSPNMTGNNTFTVTTANLVDGDTGWVESRGSAPTNGGGVLIVNGITINDQIATNGNWRVEWSWDGSTLNSTLVVDPQTVDWIENSMIATDAVNADSIAANAVDTSEINAGAVTTPKLDPANINLNTIGLPGSISQALLDAALQASLGTGVKSVSIALTSANILALNTTPIVAAPAPGAGVYIEVISASFLYTYATAVYTTNTQVNLRIASTALPQKVLPGVLAVGGSVDWVFSDQAPSGASSQLAANQALLIESNGGDPGGTGTGTAIVKILYREYS